MGTMSGPRSLQPLPVSPGAAALDIVPALRSALDGEGPALLPLAAEHTAEAGRLRTALRADDPLAPGEDDTADPTALVIATSGSTGTPKGVLLSISALRASAAATHRHLGGPGHWLLAMPAQHIAGIQVLVRAILAGTQPHAMDTSEGFRAERFAAAAYNLPTTEAPRYTALVPTQLRRLLDDPTGLAALRTFDAVLLGGAATPAELLRRARDQRVRIVTTYGMSETAGGCVYDGAPLDITQVRVRAEEPNGCGPILLSGATRARGYRDRPDAAEFAGGWFHTGDLGQWQDGRLTVLGRADDMIVSGGVNVAPEPVERVLSGQRGVREVCVFGLPDREWGQAVGAAVVPGDDVPDSAELCAAVREKLAPAAVPKRLTFLSELPLRGPGKPDRRALAELFDSTGWQTE